MGAGKNGRAGATKRGEKEVDTENNMTIVIQNFRMRYPVAHKPTTRRKIVEAASQAFRERGVGRTGVDEVMRRAGLTHGGFYAHFKDKSELVAEACAAGFEEALPNLDRIAARATAAERARLLIDSYLAPRHRENRSSGCVIVAVAADMARELGVARKGFSAGFLTHLRRLEAALRLSEGAAENREQVIELMSALVGALLFARAVDDERESDEILRIMRRRLKARLGGGGEESAERRGRGAETAAQDKSGAGRQGEGNAERRGAETPPYNEGAERFSPSHDLLKAF